MSDETTPEATPEVPQPQATPQKAPGHGNEEIVNALRYMYKELQTTKGQIDSLQGSAPAPQAEASAHGPVAEDTDVEMLDNKGMIGLMESRLQERLRPLAEGIQHLNNTSARTAVDEQVVKLRNDDTAYFDSFVNEVRDIMEEKGGAISVEEALVLAKAKDPEKVTRLDGEKRETAPQEPDPFVGLLPTSGKSSRNERMEAKDAANAAWDELGLESIIKEIAN